MSIKRGFCFQTRRSGRQLLLLLFGDQTTIIQKTWGKEMNGFHKKWGPHGQGGGGKETASTRPQKFSYSKFCHFCFPNQIMSRKKLVPRRSGKIVLSKKFCFFIYVNHNPSIVDRGVANFYSFSFSLTLSLSLISLNKSLPAS